jgi:hypothetical protein
VSSTALAMFLMLGHAGCSSYVKRGEALYADGRYVEAAEVFERTELRLSESSVRQRAEYGLYRGLTLLVLGDLPNAHRWMTYAYNVERARPGSLGAEHRARLDHGWSELGRRMRVDLPKTPTEVASRHSATQEAPEVFTHPGSGIGSPDSPTQRSLVPRTP